MNLALLAAAEAEAGSGLFGEGSLAPLFFAAGVGMLIAMMLRRTARKWEAEKKKKPVRSGIAPTESPSSYASASDQREVEMHSLARDMMGQLDSKMILLQELVDKSQRQIDRMEVLLDEVEKVAASGNG